MSRTNPKNQSKKAYTAPGGWAWPHLTAEQELERSVLAHFLWEDLFYEDGVSHKDRILEISKRAAPAFVSELARRARKDHSLRHIPLILAASLDMRDDVKGSGIVRETVYEVIERPDEMAELLALSCSLRKSPVSELKKVMTYSVRRGIADAFGKFDSYQLLKRLGTSDQIKLRDVIALCHPTPASKERSDLYASILDGSARAPDTWEKSMSAGKGGKKTFTELLESGKLGYMALLRNLRKMNQSNVDENLIGEAILARKGAGRVLPMRFISAARHAPKFEPELDRAMVDALQQREKLAGKTLIIVDVSGSMNYQKVSGHSELDALDAAAALAAVAREMCEKPVVYATGGSDIKMVHKTMMIPPRHGMALIDAIKSAPSEVGHGGIFTNQMLEFIADKERGEADRILIITDEQDVDRSRNPLTNVPFGHRNYLLNVAGNKNGIGYGGGWTAHLTGYSEKVLDYIMALERQMDSSN